jgi:hypothetical protein
VNEKKVRERVLDTLIEYKICLNCDLLNFLSSYSCSDKIYKELRQHQTFMGTVHTYLHTFTTLPLEECIA